MATSRRAEPDDSLARPPRHLDRHLDQKANTHMAMSRRAEPDDSPTGTQESDPDLSGCA